MTDRSYRCLCCFDKGVVSPGNMLVHLPTVDRMYAYACQRVGCSPDVGEEVIQHLHMGVTQIECDEIHLAERRKTHGDIPAAISIAKDYLRGIGVNV